MSSSSHTYLKNQQAEEKRFRFRLQLVFLLITLLLLFLLGRFIWLQGIQHKHFSTLAQSNRISLVPILPNRGLVLDRNGIVLARNYSANILEITPSQVPDLKKTLEILHTLVDISPRDERIFQRLMKESRPFEPLPLKNKVTDEEAARVAARAWMLPGVKIKARLFRDYPYGLLTSHVLGYIGRISQKDLDNIDEDNLTNYKGSTYIGKTGLEKTYEADLHGKVGFEEVETDAAGHAVRVLRRIAPVNGDTLTLSLDIRLQEVADQLFGDRRGALVAIDPENGGILAFLSKPGFDPNLFIDGIDTQTWNSLNDNWERPLINRALRGTYPPGSTLKPFIGMAALMTHAIGPNDLRPAPGYFTLPGSSHQFRDSKRSGNGTVNLKRAIEVSSDTFFYRLAWEMGIEKIHPYLEDFGFGQKTGIDLDGESTGILPSKQWKAKRFARYGKSYSKWYPADTVNIGIGQGYNTYTPLQLAQATAIMANNGIVFQPHLVKAIQRTGTGNTTLVAAAPVRRLPFPQNDFQYIKQAMQGVMQRGTGARIGAGASYTMAGKTGTAQVIQIKQGATYNAHAIAEQHRDHSWFIAFAPVEKPKIAIAVIVENGGFGAASAGPIVRALFDYYLLNKIPPQLQGKLKMDASDATPDPQDPSR